MSSDVLTVNVTELIDQPGHLSFRARIFILCALATLFDGAEAALIGLSSTSIASSLHMPMSKFGPIFGAGQAGLMIGALSLGMAADRFGRKRLIVASVAIFGLFTFITSFATSYNEILILRFLTGLGMGGATPNVIAMMSEYSPKRLRIALAAAVWASFPLGGAVYSLIGAWIIKVHGWRMAFKVGGIAPICLAMLIMALLPESAAFMVARGMEPGKIAKVIRKFTALPQAATVRFSSNEKKLIGLPFAHLFKDGWAVRTLLLWVPFFGSFLSLIFVTSWTPTAMRAHGFNVSQIGFAFSLNYIGSIVGSSLVGRVMDKVGVYKVLPFVFILNILCLGSLGYVMGNLNQVAFILTAHGFFAGSSQAGVIALAALVYPTAVRSTAVGWGMAIGRFGAVVGPIVGGILLGLHWKVEHIFTVVTVAPMCGLFCIIALRHFLRDAGRGAEELAAVASGTK